MYYDDYKYECIYQTELGFEIKIKWSYFIGVVSAILYSPNELTPSLCGYVSGDKLPNPESTVKSEYLSSRFKGYFKLDKEGLSVGKYIPKDSCSLLVYTSEVVN